MLRLPGINDGWDRIEALVAKVGSGTDALQPKQLQHPNGLGSHAAREVDGSTEQDIAGRHVPVQKRLVLPGAAIPTGTDLKDV